MGGTICIVERSFSNTGHLCRSLGNVNMQTLHHFVESVLLNAGFAVYV